MQITNGVIQLLDKSGVKRAARIVGEAFAGYPVHAIFADDSEGRRVEIATAVFQMEIGYHCRRKGAYTLKNTAIYGSYGFRVIKELQHDFEGLYSYFMLIQPEQV